MMLKRLTLLGFKSFADKVEFEFDRGITCVVGPNGCGKSNIVDAIKWVLGEQSAKSLRGSQMQDVIFNGSGTRKPAGMAQVDLTFENTDRKLAVDTDEVVVTRRLFRDGTSEYLVNGHEVRLKDIREMFLDTGVGFNAYSIVEQGHIEALLQANPQERRQIIDEAAGISKYRVRVKECQRKLERTDQNLLRVNDILEELQRRLRSVKVQAGRAKSWQEYTTRLKELRSLYVLNEYRKYAAELEQRNRDVQIAREQSLAVHSRIAAQDADAATLDAAIVELDARISAVESDLQIAASNVDTQRERIAQTHRRMQEGHEALEAARRQALAAKAQRQVLAEKVLAHRAQLGELDREAAALNERIEAMQAEDRAAAERISDIAARAESAKSQMLDLVRQISHLRSEQAQGEDRARSLGAQRNRLADRLADAHRQIESIQQRCTEIDRRLHDLNQQQAETAGRLNDVQDRCESLDKRRAALTAELGSLKERRSGLVSRLQLLEELNRRYEGIAPVVKTLLAERDRAVQDGRPGGIVGVLGELIEADLQDAGWIEGALAGLDQVLVIDRREVILAEPQKFTALPGKVQILALDAIRNDERDAPAGPASPLGDARDRPSEDYTGGTEPPVAPGDDAKGVQSGVVAAAVQEASPAGPVECGGSDTAFAPWTAREGEPGFVSWAAKRVRYDPRYEAAVRWALGRVGLTETLVDAVRLAEKAPTGYRFISRDGQVVEASGTLVLGRGKAGTGLISRRSELRQIHVELRGLDAQIADAQGVLASTAAEYESLLSQSDDLRGQIQELQKTAVQSESQLRSERQNVQRLSQEEQLLQSEIDLLDEQVRQATARAAEAAEQVKTLETRQGDLQRDIDTSQEQLQQAQAARASVQERLTQERVAAGQLAEKRAGVIASLRQTQHDVDRAVQEHQRSVSAVELAGQRLMDAERTLLDAQQHLAYGCQKKEALQRDALQWRKERSDCRSRLEKLHESLKTLRQQYDTEEARFRELELAASQLQLRIETLVQRTKEELQIDLTQKTGVGGRVSAVEHRASGIEHRVSGDGVGGDSKTGAHEVQEAASAAQAPQEEEQPAEPQIPEQIDWAAVEAEIAELRGRIERLGHVNLEAIGEMADLEQRSGFLAAQQKDLADSKRQLEELIGRLNEESQRRFVEAFEQVRAHFQELFRKLFGGGRADLVLTNPEDVLESGVDILARPPGKELQSISLLSGGEKALTAMSLVMAVFRSKPSPFTILDEADAALDEANNDRFTRLLREFLTYSQFIVMSHSKRTMSVADVLYGVTMQEAGVSKRVAVRFSDASGAQQPVANVA
jgi:chromosome segregation protein